MDRPKIPEGRLRDILLDQCYSETPKGEMKVATDSPVISPAYFRSSTGARAGIAFPAARSFCGHSRFSPATTGKERVTGGDEFDSQSGTPRMRPTRMIDSTRKESKTPLILIHGFTSSTYSWKGVFGPLAKNRRVIAVDLRGSAFRANPMAIIRGARRRCCWRTCSTI